MDVRIREVLDYIEGHLSEKLTLKELASHACMSPSQFHKVFKKETGHTPFSFVEEIKMSKAYELLVAGNVMVYELADQLGYRDYETFTRAFKKHFLFAPDDLKAIAEKIRTDMNVGPDKLFIRSFEVEKISEVKGMLDQMGERLKGLIEEAGFTEEDLKKAKVLSVMPKMDGMTDATNVIRNKFVINENKKIWKALLNHKLNGND